MRSLNKYVRTSSHSDELTGDFGNKPEAILIGDHFLSCLLAEKLSLRDLRLLQQYRHKADVHDPRTDVRFGGQSIHWLIVAQQPLFVSTRPSITVALCVLYGLCGLRPDVRVARWT